MRIQDVIDMLEIFCKRHDCEIERVTVVTKTPRDRAYFEMGVNSDIGPLHLDPRLSSSDLNEITINGITLRVL